MKLPALPFTTADGEEILLIHDPENHTFWATQKQMAIMFGVTLQAINEHIKKIESELSEPPTIKPHLIVQMEGKRKVQREVLTYNHEMILAIGFRCHSERARRYQKWAVDVLYLELMREKRDLEKEAYKNLVRTMTFATDYESNNKDTHKNFAKMQDMMHYAAAGLSDAGIIIHRADRQKDHMGLTSFVGKAPVKKEVTVAKNYLTEEEIDLQHKITVGFMHSIEIAIMGRNKWQYTQAQLIKELKRYLLFYNQEVAGDKPLRYSRAEADKHAHTEYEAFRALLEQRLDMLAAGIKITGDEYALDDEFETE